MEDKKIVVCIIEDMDFPNLTSFVDFVRAYNTYHLSDYFVFCDYYYWNDNVYVVISSAGVEEDFYTAVSRYQRQYFPMEAFDVENANWKWEATVNGDGDFVWVREKGDEFSFQYYIQYDENVVRIIPERGY